MRNSRKVIFIFIALFAFYLGNRFGEIYHSTVSKEFADKLAALNENFYLVLSLNNLHISLQKNDLIWGFVSSGCAILAIIYILFSKKNYMAGKEHGSAKWGTTADISKLIDRKYDNNILFTQTERMSLNTRKTHKNNNVLIVGDSGSGKTRFFVKPNLMQLHTSYVVTDPKGSLILECGKMFADNGYKIKVLNLVDFLKSMHYNPFKYIEDEKDILTFATQLVNTLKDKNEKQDFFVNSEILLYQALIGYIYYFLPDNEKNIESFLRLFGEMKVTSNGSIDVVDVLFAEVEEIDPNNYALLQFKKYKKGADAIETLQGILMSCGVRLAPFEVPAVKELMRYDELELDTIGDEKTILFIISSDTDTTYNFLANFVYTQLFDKLCKKADTVYSKKGSRLPVHVRCILDEFANLGKIPNFEHLISTIRSREISANIILQDFSQIDAIYDKYTDTIINNCPSKLFLGGNGNKTTKTISEMVGKTTVDHLGTSTRKGIHGDYTISDQIIGRELITSSEVALLDDNECILSIRGVKPFKSKKIVLEKCSRYKQLADYDDKNLFDVTEYINTQRKKQLDNNMDVDSKIIDIA